jgi:hypothetical protein
MRSALLLSIVLGLAQTVPSAAHRRTAAHTTIHHWSVTMPKATALAPPVAASSSPPSRDADGLKTKAAGNPPRAQWNCEPPCVTVLRV